MGVGSSRNDRMFVVDRKALHTLERLDTSFNRTASQLKTILNEEIQLIKKIDPKDTRALSKALDTLIILRERSVMYRARIRKMIPLTDAHRLVLKDLRRYLRRIRYHTSKIGRLLGKSNKKFNAYIEKLPQDIVPIRTRKYRKRFTKPITKAGLMNRVNKLPRTEGNAPYVEVVANVEPRNKEALFEMSQVVDDLEERNKNVARPSRIQNNIASRNNTAVKMAQVKSKEAINREEIRSEERVERNKLRLEREKLASEQREKDANRRSHAKIESQKIIAADRERRNARDKEAANRRFQGEIERQKIIAADRERRNARDKEAANRRLELQKQREEVRATTTKDIAERSLQEKKLSLEEAKQKRLNKQRVIFESREERLRKARGQGVRPLEQRQRESRSMEQRMPRSMSQGSIPSQQIFVGSQPQGIQNTNSVQTLDMRLKQEAKLNERKQKALRESQKEKMKLEKMRLEMSAKSNSEKRKLEKQEQKRKEKKTKQELELERMRMKSNERQKREEKKAESLEAGRERRAETLKEKREALLADKKIKSNERLALKNKELSKQEANEKKRHAKKEEEKEALLAKQSRKNALRTQKIENNKRKENARKEKKEERKQNDDEKEEKKKEKEEKIESQKELFSKLLGMYTAWKVDNTQPVFKNNNTLSIQDITSVDALVKNTDVKTFARRKIAGFTPSIFAKYKQLHKNVAVEYLKSSSSKNKEKEIKQANKNKKDAAVKENEERTKEVFIIEINKLSIDDLKDVRAYLLAWRPNIITKKPRIVSHVLSGGVKTSVAQQIIKDVIPKNDVIYEWYKTYSRNTKNNSTIKLTGDSWGPLPEDKYTGIRDTYINVFKKIKTDINGVKNDKGYDDIKRKWFGRKNTSNVKKSIEDMDGIQEYIMDKELAVLSDKMKCGEITGFKGELHANFKRFMNTNKKIANKDKQNAFNAVQQFLIETDIEKLYIITTKRPKKIDTLNETEGCILRNYLHEHFFTDVVAYKMYIGTLNNKNVSSVFSYGVNKMKKDIDTYLGKVSLEELYEIRRDTGKIYNGKSRKQLNEIGTFKAKVVSIFIKNNIILKLDDALEKIGNLKVHEKLLPAFRKFKAKYEKLKDNPFYKQIVGQALGFDVKIELPKFMVSKGASIKMNAPKPPMLKSSKRFILKISDVAIPRLQAGKLAKLKIPQTSKMTISLPKTAHIIIPKATVIQLKSSTKRGLLSIPRPSGAKYFSINGRVIPFVLNVPIKLPQLRSSQNFSLSFHPETPKLIASIVSLKVPKKKMTMTNQDKKLTKKLLKIPGNNLNPETNYKSLRERLENLTGKNIHAINSNLSNFEISTILYGKITEKLRQRYQARISTERKVGKGQNNERDPIRKNENMTPDETLVITNPEQLEAEMNAAGEQLAKNMEKIQKKNIIDRIKKMRNEYSVLSGDSLGNLNKISEEVTIQKLKNIYKIYEKEKSNPESKKSQIKTVDEKMKDKMKSILRINGNTEYDYNVLNKRIKELTNQKIDIDAIHPTLSNEEINLILGKENIPQNSKNNFKNRAELIGKFLEQQGEKYKEIVEIYKNKKWNSHEDMMNFLKNPKSPLSENQQNQNSPQMSGTSSTTRPTNPGVTTLNPIFGKGGSTKPINSRQSTTFMKKSKQGSSPRSASGTVTQPPNNSETSNTTNSKAPPPSLGSIKIKGENVKALLEMHLGNTGLDRMYNEVKLDKLRNRLLLFIGKQTIPRNKIVLSSQEIMNIKSSNQINKSLQEMYRDRKVILDKLSHPNRALLWAKPNEEYLNMTGNSHKQILSFLDTKLTEINQERINVPALPPAQQHTSQGGSSFMNSLKAPGF